MNTELLFHKRAIKNRNTIDTRDLHSEYRIALKQELAQERQLSPWSSDQNRNIPSSRQFQTIKYQNIKVNTMRNKDIKVGYPLNINKGRSVELNPLKKTREQKISKDLINLVKLQKKQPMHKPSRETNHNIKLSKVEMSLSIDEPETRRYRANISQIDLPENIYRQFYKQQPMHVKISKKMMKKIKMSDFDDPRPHTDRNNLNQTMRLTSRDRFDHNSEKKMKLSRKVNGYEHATILPNIGVQTSGLRDISEPEEMICKGDPMRVTVKDSKKGRLYNPHEFVSHLGTKQKFFIKY